MPEDTPRTPPQDPAAPPILVTGAAGFIGFHLSRQLLALGCRVLGIDDLNAYYDPALKQARLDLLAAHPLFEFRRLDLADQDAVAALFAGIRPRRVLHLAAQAGVRHSLADPGAYARSNLAGFLSILEGCRHAEVDHLVTR
jgi:UDP-glucuronate 4-epimerase